MFPTIHMNNGQISQGGIHVRFEGDLRRKQKTLLAQRRTDLWREYIGASRFFDAGAAGAETLRENIYICLGAQDLLPMTWTVFPRHKFSTVFSIKNLNSKIYQKYYKTHRPLSGYRLSG